MQVNIQDSLKKITQRDLMNSEQPEKTECEIHKTPLTERKSIISNRISLVCLTCQTEDEERRAKLEAERIARERQSKIDKRLHNAMISPRFKEKTFENFRTELDGQKKAVEVCKWFLENWDKSMGLIFMGGPGTGKNHLASALVKAFVVEKDRTALMTETMKIVRAIKESWRSENTTESQAISAFIQPDLLVIDEVGVQFGTETEKLFLTEIINDRYNAMKPTILIGNVTLDELRAAIGDRAVERFKEGGKIVAFKWASQRGKLN